MALGDNLSMDGDGFERTLNVQQLFEYVAHLEARIATMENFLRDRDLNGYTAHLEQAAREHDAYLQKSE